MQKYSFYYRESLNLKSLFPQACKFSLLFSDEQDNLAIENGVMFLRNPETFNPSRIHSIVRVYLHKYDYFKIVVSIRCWREGDYSLKETTQFKSLQLFKFYRFIKKVINKIHLIPVRVHLLTEGGVSYYCCGRNLVKRQNGRLTNVGKIPRLTDPIYYEFLLYGNEAFFRTGPHIYLSSNEMRQWHLIYEGKRAIKNSMVWIEEEKALLFSEYTPGLNLCRHHLYKYYVASGKTKKVFTFYSPKEYQNEGKTPYCRHIHVLMKDSYTGDIYMGVGDADDESAIYRSTDNGNSFTLVGSGNQKWRTLSFIFTKENIFWNTDSPDPQYISCIDRKQLNDLPIKTENVKHWPIFNSASWNSVYDAECCLYVMSASCEGTLYDNKNRVYGIRLDNDKPTVYSLFEDESRNKEIVSRGHQLFVLGRDNEGIYWFYDTRHNYYRQFILTRLYII